MASSNLGQVMDLKHQEIWQLPPLVEADLVELALIIVGMIDLLS